MKLFNLIFTLIVLLSSCEQKTTPAVENTKPTKPQPIQCSDNGCSGTYIGPEFINRSDIAHQFSNSMSGAVGDKLKELYKSEKYSQVDFENIVMTTEGMGSGNVTYYLSIPFKKVSSKCEAYTSFDHVGGWNHTPALSQRIKQLNTLLLENDQLYISDLKKTPEGLEEYWIQCVIKKFRKNMNPTSYSQFLLLHSFWLNRHQQT